MRLAPGSSELKTPANNKTIYICYGTKDGVTAEQRANMKSQGALWLPAGKDPMDFLWPVNGCGVILMDYAPLNEHTAQLLGLAVKRDGGESLIWANFPADDSSLIFGNNI